MRLAFLLLVAVSAAPLQLLPNATSVPPVNPSASHRFPLLSRSISQWNIAPVPLKPSPSQVYLKQPTHMPPASK